MQRLRGVVKRLIVGVMCVLFIVVVGLIIWRYAFNWPAWLPNWPEWLPLLLVLFEIVLLFLLIQAGYTAQWTGFSGEYDKETTATENSWSVGKVTTTTERQPGKTLWDWLRLLIIPLVLASATIGFGLWQAHLNDVQHTNDQLAARDQQQATILQTYIDKIQDLMINDHLLESNSNDLNNKYYHVAVLARARTLTTLEALNKDPQRKFRLLAFLYEARLIGYAQGQRQYRKIIDLSNADFTNIGITGYWSGIDLSNAYLRGDNFSNANLSEANLSGTGLRELDESENGLSGANLSNTNLSNANLSEAYLRDAKLSNTNLSNANLSEADLGGAYLGGAKLSNTNLSNANLSEADLSEAYLGGANLSRASLGKTILKDARYNTKEILLKNEQGKIFGKIAPTQWPQDFDPKAKGAIEDSTAL